MIKIEGLSKHFRTEEVETIALNNISSYHGTFRLR